MTRTVPRENSPFWWQADWRQAGGRHAESRGLRLGFTSVTAGNLGRHVGDPQDAEANRRALERHLGQPTGTLQFLHQTHSADVVDASTYPSGGPASTGDAWISPTGQHALAILVADCLPVLFTAEGRGGALLTAAAHAGRPGLLAGILDNTLQALREAGAERITAWIGPGACGQCYEIPEDMVAEIAAERPAIRSQTRWGSAALDLRAEAVRILTAAGADVVDLGGCTIEDPRLFSHRRSQQQGEPAGRIAAVICPSR
ncbi:polyphenol oxidase family protein [Nesterenkonia alba]|uniref:polyphenol oxidase family protein n=1 Tax=Nesterenkonia alba TaxID=515814 RepID=UPI0003B73FAF|nr:polyphenol oxidase family protein [Nesterenkonia alba]